MTDFIPFHFFSILLCHFNCSTSLEPHREKLWVCHITYVTPLVFDWVLPLDKSVHLPLTSKVHHRLLVAVIEALHRLLVSMHSFIEKSADSLDI